MCTVHDDKPELARLPRLRKSQIKGLLGPGSVAGKAQDRPDLTLARSTPQHVRYGVVVGALAILLFAPTVSAHPKGCGPRSPPANAAQPTECKITARNVFSRPAPRVTLGIGDVVSVTIFEAEPGGLLIPSGPGARPGNFVTLPNQVVDTNGNITVPYVGTIRALGRTPAEVQEAINEALTRAPR
jgi:Polysaccharide biosynthesis/export protein